MFFVGAFFCVCGALKSVFILDLGMGKPSKRKYLQTFLERALQAQRHSHQPESFEALLLWVRQRLEQQPTPNAPRTPKKPKPKLDPDLAALSQKALKYEVQRLRDAIRLHRDEQGHGRCWLDDQQLYQVLPEQQAAQFALPPRAEFLENCARYWQERQPHN
jgi:hypothetical protein